MKSYTQAKLDAKKKLSHYFSQFEVLSHENITEIEGIIDDIETMIDQRISYYDSYKHNILSDIRDRED